jgi:4-alpha-glucanotransferase
MIETLARLSNKYGCLVIGEDLGNLPQGLQGELEAANILSYRILSYEQNEKGFNPPDQYPALALACVSTHDHQTFSGWWRAADVMMREKNDLVPEEAARQQKSERKSERRDVLSAFREADLIGSDPVDHSSRKRLAATAHAFVAKTASLLMAVRLADLTDEKLPTNVPGTSDSYPNWKPKLSVMLEELDALPELHDILTEVAAGRGSQG